MRRPRVRAADGSGELAVPAYELFASTELLGELALERMMAKLSTRRYRPAWSRSARRWRRRPRSTSKSSVSRRFVARTEVALAELLAADLSGLDLVALMVDGVHFAESCCVVALGIAADGTKVPLGVVEGATENATVVTDLLVGLRDRGLDVTRPMLVVIDGVQGARLGRAGGLRPPRDPALPAAQGPQRRGQAAQGPRRPGGQEDAGRLPRPRPARRPGRASSSSPANSTGPIPAPPASLREGLAETLTVGRLGVPPTLARTLRSTDEIVNPGAAGLVGLPVSDEDLVGVFLLFDDSLSR